MGPGGEKWLVHLVCLSQVKVIDLLFAGFSHRDF